jgi:hypothetical protein
MERDTTKPAELADPFIEPMTVRAVDGEVVVLGPDSVAISLSPDAAEESARRLIEAAEDARQEGPPASA